MESKIKKTIKLMAILVLLISHLGIAQEHQEGILIDTLPDGTFQTQEYFIRSDDKKVNLYLREKGKGQPVIVLHGGFGNDHTNVIKIADGLEKEYRFIFYDQRGSTLSYCDKDDISVENHLIDLETIRRKLQLEKFTLVSHSAGTVLALEYLKKNPERVENLILLGAMDPKNGNPDYFSDDEKKNWEIHTKQKQEFNNRTEIDTLLKSLGLNKKSKTPKEYQLYLHIKYYAAQNIYNLNKWDQVSIPHWNPIAAKAASESYGWEYNFTGLLNSVEIPVSVINGEYDLVVGAKGSPIWKSIIKNDVRDINLYLIKKAGHLSWIDDPIEFKRLFRESLLQN